MARSSGAGTFFSDSFYPQYQENRPHIVAILCLSDDLVLPLSGLLYDDHYVKNDPGWYVGRMGKSGFWFWAGTAFYVGFVCTRLSALMMISSFHQWLFPYIFCVFIYTKLRNISMRLCTSYLCLSFVKSICNCYPQTLRDIAMFKNDDKSRKQAGHSDNTYHLRMQMV